ncbi:MAG: hypothetical protein ACR2L6_00485 [Gemmatimonadaceae bacterium]
MTQNTIGGADQDRNQETQPALGSADIHRALRDIEETLALPGGSLADLPLESNDWVFVIRAQAIVEAALAHLLVGHIRVEKIRPLIQRLPVSWPFGKLEIARKWDLLDKMNVSFVRSFNALRNVLAHDPAYVGFTFWDYLSTVGQKERATFRKLSRWSGPLPPEVVGQFHS